MKPVWQALLKQNLAILVVVSQVLNPAVVFAGQAVQLSDEELDGVFAQGFKISFDVSVAQVQSLTPKAPTVPTAPKLNAPKPPAVPTAPKITNPVLNGPIGGASQSSSTNSNSSNLLSAGSSGMNALFITGRSQQFLSSLVNVNAVGSIVPVMLNLMININSIIQNATNTNALDITNFYDVDLPASALTPSTNQGVQPQSNLPAPVPAASSIPDPVNSGFVLPPDQTVTSTTQTSSSEPGLNSLIPQVNNQPGTSTAPPENPFAPILENSGGGPDSGSEATGSLSNPVINIPVQTPETTNSLPESSAASSLPQTAVENPAESLLIGGGQNPAVTLLDPVQQAASGGTLPDPVTQPVVSSPADVLNNPLIPSLDPEIPTGDLVPGELPSLPAESEGPPIDISSISPVPSAGTNILYVGDQSQQYLSSLVNVNSAGSVVPVLINLIINIDSKVNNMSNSNQLKLEDHYRFHLR